MAMDLMLDDVEEDWEFDIRHHYISSRRRELDKVTGSLLRYKITQWDVHSLLMGGFVSQMVISLISGSYLSLSLSLYVFLVLYHIRLCRDVYTLNTGILSLTLYTVVVTTFVCVAQEYDVSNHMLLLTIILTVSHFYALLVLNRYGFGIFDTFFENSFEFKIPTLCEVHGSLVGIISFLGLIFAIVHLYVLTYATFVTVVFASVARWRYKRSLVSKKYHFFPTVPTLLGTLFTTIALSVVITSLVEGNILSLSNQKSFLLWISDNDFDELYVNRFFVLTIILTIVLFFFWFLQLLFLIQLFSKAKCLEGILYGKFIIIGYLSNDSATHESQYKLDLYILDPFDRVCDVDNLYKRDVERGVKLNYNNVYNIIQLYMLKKFNERSLYSFFGYHVPLDPLKEDDPLIKCRMILESWNRELEEIVELEREHRESVKEINIPRSALRPKFKSTSIPFECERRQKRTLSIPINLSLQSVDDIYPVTKYANKLKNERSKTTCISDDFYCRDNGIIDRVRGSWLEAETNEKELKIIKPSFVSRDGVFDFPKVDEALASIIDRLSILYDQPPMIIDVGDLSPKAQSDKGVSNKVIGVSCPGGSHHTPKEADASRRSAARNTTSNTIPRTANEIISGSLPEGSKEGTASREDTLTQSSPAEKTPQEGTRLQTLRDDTALLMPPESFSLSSSEKAYRHRLKFRGKRNVKNLTKFFNHVIRGTSSNDPDESSENVDTDHSGHSPSSPDNRPGGGNNVILLPEDPGELPPPSIERKRSVILLPDDSAKLFEGPLDSNNHLLIDIGNISPLVTNQLKPRSSAPVIRREYEICEVFRNKKLNTEMIRLSYVSELPLALNHSTKDKILINRPRAKTDKNTTNGTWKDEAEAMKNNNRMNTLCSSGGDSNRLHLTLEDLLNKDIEPHTTESTPINGIYNGLRSLTITPMTSQTEDVMRELLKDVDIDESEKYDSDASFNYIWEN